MPLQGRQYNMSFQNVSVTAVQDLLAIYCGAAKIVGILAVNVGQITGTTVANLRIRIRYLAATVTSGSAGAAGTIKPWVSGDAAATATGRTNDTTQASSATAIDLYDDVFSTTNGFYWQPPATVRPPVIGLSGACIVSLDTAPSGAIVCNGSILFEELP